MPLIRKARQKIVEWWEGPRAVVKGDNLEETFLDRGKYRIKEKGLESSQKTEMKRKFLQEDLAAHTAQEFSRELVKSTLMGHLADHEITLKGVMGRPPTVEQVINEYHKREQAGEIDPKYRFDLGKYNNALAARLGNLLAETEKAHGFVFQVAGKESVGRTLAKYGHWLRLILRDELAPELRKHAELPQIQNAEHAALAIHTAVGHHAVLPVKDLKRLVQQRITRKEYHQLENQIAQFRGEISRFPPSAFNGANPAERRKNMAAAFIALAKGVPPENYAYLFGGNDSLKHAKDFQLAILKYPLLAKLYSSS